MKLTDFLKFEPLNKLKDSMGIPRHVLGSVRGVVINTHKATLDELRQLGDEGLEIDLADLIVLQDGTLSYKDRRVLLYIRDVSAYGGRYSEPKFHFSDCSTLSQMKANRRFGKYVIANRTDGIFTLLFVDTRRRVQKHLDVCQNCLDLLKYKGFSLTHVSVQRQKVVNSFSIEEFFTQYPRTLHRAEPVHTSDTAPENIYSASFPEISRAYRSARSWKCEECAIDLSKPEHHRFLHVHHLNGLKNENDYRNLRALCLHCHSLQPAHGHMRHSFAYRDFEAIWQEWNAGNARGNLYAAESKPFAGVRAGGLRLGGSVTTVAANISD